MKVFSEWKDFRSKALAENALANNTLAVQDPCPLSIQKTMEKCNESGTVLSDADISLVALAIELSERLKKFVVVTDDYSVQNVLKRLRVKFVGVAQGVIKKTRSFRQK